MAAHRIFMQEWTDKQDEIGFTWFNFSFSQDMKKCIPYEVLIWSTFIQFDVLNRLYLNMELGSMLKYLSISPPEK